MLRSFVIFKFIFEAKPKNAGILPYFKAFRQAFALNLFSKTDTALWSVSLGVIFYSSDISISLGSSSSKSSAVSSLSQITASPSPSG